MTAQTFIPANERPSSNLGRVILPSQRLEDVTIDLADALERLLFWVDEGLPPTEDAILLARQAHARAKAHGYV